MAESLRLRGPATAREHDPEEPAAPVAPAPSLTHVLARLPAEQRKAQLADMSRFAGNAAISRMLARKPNPKVVERITNPEWDPFLQAASETHRVPVALLRAIMAAESGGNPDSGKGGSGYKGLMQAEQDASHLDPATSIEGGAKKYREMADRIAKRLSSELEQLGVAGADLDDVEFAAIVLLAYNAGQAVVIDAVREAAAAGDVKNWLDAKYYAIAVLKWASFTHRYAKPRIATMSDAELDANYLKLTGKEIRPGLAREEKEAWVLGAVHFRQKAMKKARPKRYTLEQAEQEFGELIPLCARRKHKNSAPYADKMRLYYRHLLDQDGAAAAPAATKQPVAVPEDDVDEGGAEPEPVAENVPRAQRLVGRTPASDVEHAQWLLDAADLGFVTLGKARRNLEDAVAGRPVGAEEIGTGPTASATDVTFDAFDHMHAIVRGTLTRWIADPQSAVEPVTFNSFVRRKQTSAVKNDPHRVGKAVDIVGFSFTGGPERVIEILGDLPKGAYGIGLPFQGEFFDLAHALGPQKTANEKAAAGAAPAPIKGAVTKFRSHIFGATWGARKGGGTGWTDQPEQRGKAWTKLKSAELRDTITDMKRSGYDLTIFPDNKNHLHVDRRGKDEENERPHADDGHGS